MSEERPKLRSVEAFPVAQDGRRFAALRDPAGYTASVIMVPVEVVEILSRFDGEHSIVDIQSEIMRARGELVYRQQIEELVEALDEHGFLDSPRFAERRAAILDAFRSAPTRAAVHAGGAYPGDPEELRRALDGFFESAGGPGAIDWNERSRANAVDVAGIIAPHIDLHRGGPAYAWAYRDLAERSDADLFVIFGTCHAGMADPFAVTQKDYDTPFGPAPVDRDFVEALAKRSPVDLFGSELAHRAEHSIEFQAVFLRHLYGAPEGPSDTTADGGRNARRREFTIVPILTSFAHEALAHGTSPEADPRIEGFFDALLETVQASGRRVAFIAGADLAHVGPRFGDPEPVSEGALGVIGHEDRAMLRAVEAGDPKGFFASVAADRDKRRICGLSPIWSLLRVLHGRRGRLLHYGQWPDPQAVVTYTSMSF
jgi:MEMO1 family protein